MGEDGGGDELVAHAARGFARWRAKEVINQNHRLAQRHGCQLHPGRHITHSVNRRHVGLVLFIHDHRAVGTLAHAKRLQPQTLHVG